MTASLVFLHGIGDDDRDRRWLSTLEATLRRNSVETVDSRGWQVFAPSYLRHLANPPEEDKGAAPETYVRSGKDGPNDAAGRFWCRRASVERALSGASLPSDGVWQVLPADELGELALLRTKNLQQAERYRRSPSLRNAVLRSALRGLRQDRLVIIAHSLGSVVAADLLFHLPRDCYVDLLITTGSPLSLEPLRGHLRRLEANCPFDRLGAWVNLVGRNDHVPMSRGIGRFFPEALDVFVDTGAIGGSAHAAISYLDQDVVARAFEWIDRSTGPTVGTLPAVPLTDALLRVVAGAQYALRVEQALRPGDTRRRFAQARALACDALAAELAVQGQQNSVLQRLTLDNSAQLTGAFTLEQAAEVLLQAWLLNPIQPYEIDVPEPVRLTALANFATDLGVSQGWATVIVDAAKTARAAQKRKFEWWRAGVAAVGVVLLVAAPALVVLAAPAGLAGGAAMVGGLAALGPGGMLGGLGVVGLVGGVGGGTVVAAQALGRGPSEALLSNVIFIHALAVARRRLEIAVPGHPEWFLLVQLEAVLSSERARLAKFSDKDAATLKELDLKLSVVSRTVEALRKAGISPDELEPGRPILALTAGEG